MDVSATWWLDDGATRTRRLRSEKIGVYDRRAAATTLVDQLESALVTVDGWTESDLGAPHGPYPAMADEPVSGELTRR
jgi:hypothetical protein